jgi:selenocysteine lyase/cysteine desulfurase
MLLELGCETVSGRIGTLTRHLSEGLRERGYRVLSPRGDGEESGIVSFSAADVKQHGQIALDLRANHKIEIAVREGRLRATPHFYNTIEQVDRLIAALPSMPA